jgi:uncharacterized membrane protein (DUF4010 family)
MLGIIIAASVNTVVKMGMVVAIGDRRLWLRVAPIMAGCVATGGVMYLLMY